MRGAGGSGHRLGIVLNLSGVVPATDSADDRRAAATIDALQNRLWLDALFRARYPEEIRTSLSRFGAGDAVVDGDLERIAQPLDLLGVNYYTQHHVRAASEPQPTLGSAFPGADHVAFDPPPEPRTAMGWSIEPDGLRRLLLRLRDDYDAPPILICENGAAFDDVVEAGGRIADEPRRRFLEDHIGAVVAASDAGVAIDGYLVWSLLDNFEWAYGYAKRFGLVRVDPGTLDRTVKDSGWWYRDLVAGSR